MIVYKKTSMILLLKKRVYSFTIYTHFFLQHWNFNVNSKNSKKMTQKFYAFLDNLI